MGRPDHLTCLPRNLYAGQEATNSKNQTWNNRLVPNWARSPSRLYTVTCLFNFYAECITWNARWDELQAGIKTAGRNIYNLRYADDTPLMAESEEELKSLLMRMKEESEKDDLKLSTQNTKTMASRLITSWQIDGAKWKLWQILFSWAAKSLRIVTAAMKLKDACSLEGKP